MGEVSWIKLKVGMFDDSKIKYIEALPERDTIITIWVKLLTLSGKYNEQGYIMLSENLPYNEEMLANEFNRPINSIRLAIQTFETLGMIEETIEAESLEEAEFEADVIARLEAPFDCDEYEINVEEAQEND